MLSHNPHPHPPQSHSTHDYFTANKTYFNDQASKLQDEKPGAIELARRQSKALINAYPFDEESTTAMDFACGSGLISHQLCLHVKSIIGVDISEGMIDQYNTRVGLQGISPNEMKAVCIELKGEDHSELGGMKFDVIVCASAYHHFEDIDKMTQVLSCFLKPGGKLLVCDILKKDDAAFASVFASHGTDNVVAHRGGISSVDILHAFRSAGLDEISIDESCCTARKGDVRIDFFLATGTKGR